MMKANSLVQWTKYNRNNRFMNLPSLLWQTEISGAIHLALPGLTSGSSQAGRQADEMQVNFEIVKIHCTPIFTVSTASLQLYECIPGGFFLGKMYCKSVFFLLIKY